MGHLTLPRAVALATLATATAATAQSNLTIYGRLDATVEHVRITSTTGVTRNLSTLSNDGSRFGFRGVEDLGGGLQAKFNLENGFAVDTGVVTQGGILWGRMAWVGLSSSRLGEIRLGRNTIPLDDMAWPLDPFYAGGVGALWPLLPYQSRVDNSIKYVAPMIGKLELQGLVSAGENVPGGKQFGMSAAYREQPFDLTLAYTVVKDAVAAGDRKELYLGGALKLGGPRIVASYFQRDDAGAPKLSTVNVGGNLPLGASGEARVSLTKVKQGSESTNQYAVGYWHALSKRTALYTAVMKQDNSANRNPLLTPSFAKKAPGEDASSIQLGMRHNF